MGLGYRKGGRSLTSCRLAQYFTYRPVYPPEEPTVRGDSLKTKRWKKQSNLVAASMASDSLSYGTSCPGDKILPREGVFEPAACKSVELALHFVTYRAPDDVLHPGHASFWVSLARHVLASSKQCYGSFTSPLIERL